jgi:hypothetical protein
MSNAIHLSSFLKISQEGEKFTTPPSWVCKQSVAILSPCRGPKYAQPQM